MWIYFDSNSEVTIVDDYALENDLFGFCLDLSLH